jgi:hypothetical protein
MLKGSVLMECTRAPVVPQEAKPDRSGRVPVHSQHSDCVVVPNHSWIKTVYSKHPNTKAHPALVVCTGHVGRDVLVCVGGSVSGQWPRAQFLTNGIPARFPYYGTGVGSQVAQRVKKPDVG